MLYKVEEKIQSDTTSLLDNKDRSYATGKRKRAIAKVRIYPSKEKKNKT